MKRALILLTAWALAGSSASAGPPPIKRIPDSAIWAAHVDVEAVTASTLAKGFIDRVTAKDSPVPAQQAGQIQEAWHQLLTVKSMTLYGSGFSPADAILLANLQYDEAAIRKMVGITDQTPAVVHEGHTIYTLIVPADRPDAGQERFGCFYNHELIVAGADLGKVKEALEVLDGRGKALSKDNALTAMLAPAKGSFAIAAAANMDKLVEAIAAVRSAAEVAGVPAPAAGKAKGSPPTALLRKSRSARLEIGQADQTFFATLELGMKTDKDAEHVSLFIQGMKALVLLKEPRKDDEKAKELRKLAQSIRSSFEGKRVSVEFRYPVEDLLFWADKLIASKVGGAAKAKAEQP